MSIDIFLVEQGSPESKSLALKMAEAKPGAVVPVTTEELDALATGKVQRISSVTSTKGYLEVMELRRDRRYLAIFTEGRVNLDDLINLQTSVSIDIVRTR